MDGNGGRVVTGVAEAWPYPWRLTWDEEERAAKAWEAGVA